MAALGSIELGSSVELTGEPDGNGSSTGGVVSLVDWPSVQLARIRKTLALPGAGGADQINQLGQYSDLLNSSEIDVSHGGALDESIRGGWWLAPSGGASGALSFAGSYYAGPPTFKPITNMLTEAFAVAARIMWPVAPAGTTDVDLVALIDPTGTKQVSVSLYHTISLTVCQLIQGVTANRAACNAAGTVGSGIVPLTAVDVILIWDAIANILTAQFNDAVGAQITGPTNQPNLAGVLLADITGTSSVTKWDKIALFYGNSP